MARHVNCPSDSVPSAAVARACISADGLPNDRDYAVALPEKLSEDHEWRVHRRGCCIWTATSLQSALMRVLVILMRVCETQLD